MTAPKSRSLVLHPHEIRAAQAGTLGLIVRAVKWPVFSKSDGAKARLFVVGDAPTVNELLCARDSCPLRSVKCPFGAPGSVLWAREGWAQEDARDLGRGASETIYRATAADVERAIVGRWRSAATLPEWASRFHVHVESVAVRRVQEITEEEARLAGITVEWPGIDGPLYGPGRIGFGLDAQEATARDAFGCQWDATNKRPEFKWAANPWCWFTKVRTEAR